MFRVTCIDTENGEFALYINGHYLSSEDGSGEKLYRGYSGTFIPSAGVTTETVGDQYQTVMSGAGTMWQTVFFRPVSRCPAI